MSAPFLLHLCVVQSHCPVVYHPSLSSGFLSAFVCAVMSFSFVSALSFSVCISSSLSFQSSISFPGASEGAGPFTVYPKPSSWTHLRNLLSSLPVSEISSCGIETKFASTAPLASSPSLHNPVTLYLSRAEPQAVSPRGSLQEPSGCRVLRKRQLPVAN